MIDAAFIRAALRHDAGGLFATFGLGMLFALLWIATP